MPGFTDLGKINWIHNALQSYNVVMHNSLDNVYLNIFIEQHDMTNSRHFGIIGKPLFDLSDCSYKFAPKFAIEGIT